MKYLIDTLILTYNEQLHIERAIINAKRFSKNIFVLDSFSTDKTVEIAKHLGAIVLQNKWHNNYADQLNWGLEHFTFTSPWIMRLDADEYLTDELINEINTSLEQIEENVSGIILKRRSYFMGKWMKRGIYPVKLLRIFRNGKGKCESRWMDEHIVLSEGVAVEFKNDFIDENLNTINWWTQKHNNYAVREAIDYLDITYNICGYSTADGENKGEQANKKRQAKHTYYKLPIFIRPFLYFLYRYFIKFGFTEGKVGLIFNFLQGYWYRFLVDCQIFEIERHCGHDKEKITNYLMQNYNINLELGC